MRHLLGRMTPSVPLSPALMQTWIQTPGCHTAEFQNSPELWGLPGALSGTPHVPLPLCKQRHPAQTIPMASHLVPTLALVTSPCSQNLSVHKAAWLSGLQQHNPSPAVPALGGCSHHALYFPAAPQAE